MDSDSARYPEENLDPETDNGTMPENVAELADAVVGHRIVSVEWDGKTRYSRKLVLTLDDGRRVHLVNTRDCCAYTELLNVVMHLGKINHMIMGVGTTDEYSTWHIYADFGDVLELSVDWSSGNPFYYGYGFEIQVVEAS